MLDRNVQLLIDYMGACERIHKTPLPFAYVVHLRRALLLYCFSLPTGLVNDFGWWTVPANLFVAYTFYGIEEIGVQIEDPFGTDDNDLPLERISASIDATLAGFIQESAAVSADPAAVTLGR
jgi:putative membrane protein